jgi:hypothetical protein
MLIKILSLACAAWLFGYGAGIIQRIKSKFEHWLHPYIIELWNCPMCIGFWLGLSVGIYEAFIVSVLAHFIGLLDLNNLKL